MIASFYQNNPKNLIGLMDLMNKFTAAVVRSDGVILGESLASQHEIHEEWGGIVPGLAKMAHEEKIDVVINEAIMKAGLSSIDEVDAIGVTVGPGLEICLRVGCNKARELAMNHKKPFVGIHHLEAHILMARLPFNSEASFIEGGSSEVHKSKRAIQFPFLALLVSGGHCQLMKCLGIGNYEIIGGTIDDSLGKSKNSKTIFYDRSILIFLISYVTKVRHLTKQQDCWVSLSAGEGVQQLRLLQRMATQIQ